MSSLAQPQPTSKPHAHTPRTDPGHKRGLRTVATIEFAKGLLGLLIAVGVLALVHKDVWDIADSVLQFLHINEDRHFAQAFLDLADRVTDGELWAIASLLFAYSTLRFIEAYGLWKTRVWAEWLAILSGLVYLPFEIHGLIRKSTLFRWSVVLVNLALVTYVAYVRMSGRRAEREARQVEERG